MLQNILDSVVVALIVSAIGAVIKWLWKWFKRFIASNSQSTPQEPPNLQSIPTVRRQFFICLVLLVVSIAVFFPILITGNMNTYPFLSAFAFLGMIFNFIFVWGAFDAMTMYALHHDTKDLKKSASKKPSDCTAKDKVGAQHSK